VCQQCYETPIDGVGGLSAVNKPTGQWEMPKKKTARQLFTIGAKATEDDFDRKARYIKYIFLGGLCTSFCWIPRYLLAVGDQAKAMRRLLNLFVASFVRMPTIFNEGLDSIEGDLTENRTGIVDSIMGL